jgi:hypothetical protein
VAILPAAAGITGASYLHPDVFSGGFRVAMVGAGVICAVGGVLAAFTIRRPVRTGEATPVSARKQVHCALDAPPLGTGRRITATNIGAGNGGTA